MSYVLSLTANERASHERSSKIRWGDARDAIKRAMADPDDTVQVIRFIGAIAGKSADNMMNRFLKEPHAQKILENETSLLDVLCDRERLHALPEGSLGRTYAEWTEREQISAMGLKAESEAASTGEYEDQGPHSVLGARLREMHDLIHVVTGYGRDLVGEIGVLTFTYSQTKHRGIGLIVLIGYLRSFLPGRRSDPSDDSAASRKLTRSQFINGLRRGRKARFIMGADWESLMGVQLEEVRRRFNIGAPPVYQAIRTAGAPELDDAVAG